jgi:tetrahydromethanopterin S-methyltransferase subunit G
MPNEPSLDAILVELRLQDSHQAERHKDLVQRIEKLEVRMETGEAWRNRQIGQGRAIGVAIPAVITVAINAFWGAISGRS